MFWCFVGFLHFLHFCCIFFARGKPTITVCSFFQTTWKHLQSELCQSCVYFFLIHQLHCFFVFFMRWSEILCVFVCFSRFSLWSWDYKHRAIIYREGQWSECEIGMPIHPGPWRYWTTGYWMELNGLGQSARGQSGMCWSDFAFVLFIDSFWLTGSIRLYEWHQN